MLEETKDTKEVSFVTKKALVTFSRPLAVWVNKTAIFTEACFIEFLDSKKCSDYEILPTQVKVIKFVNGPRLEKSVNVNLSYGGVYAMVILDDNEEI